MEPLRSKTKNKGQVAKSVSLPAPTAGWYVGDNIAQAPPKTAIVLNNAFPEFDYVRLRGGSQSWAMDVGTAIRLFLDRTDASPYGYAFTFNSVAAVSAWYGSASATTAVAVEYFANAGVPAQMVVARFPSAGCRARLLSSNISGLTLAQLQAINGTLSITVGGGLLSGTVNLSAVTSFASAATAIQTVLNAGRTNVGSFTSSSIAPATVTFNGQFTSSYLYVTDSVVGTVYPGMQLTDLTGAIAIIAAGNAEGLCVNNQLLPLQSGEVLGGVGRYGVNLPCGWIPNEAVTGTCGILTLGALASGYIAEGYFVTGSGVSATNAIQRQLTATTWLVSNPDTVGPITVGIKPLAVAVSYQSVTGASGSSPNAGSLLIVGNNFYNPSPNGSTMTYASGTAAASLGLTLATGALLVSVGTNTPTQAAFMNNFVENITGGNTFSTFQSLYDLDIAASSGETIQADAFTAWTVGTAYQFLATYTTSTPAAVGGGPVQSLMPWANGSISKFFAAAGGSIFDISEMGGVGAPDVSGLSANYFAYCQFEGFGSSYLLAVNGIDPVQIFDGVGWNRTRVYTGTPQNTSTTLVLSAIRPGPEGNSLPCIYAPAGTSAGSFSNATFTGGSSGIYAIAVWTQTGSRQVQNGDTFQVGQQVYTAVSSSPASPGDFLIGGTIASALSNLSAAINHNVAIGDWFQVSKNQDATASFGVAEITSLSSTDDLVVGMALTGPDITLGATIINIEGSTVLIDQPITAGGSPQSITFYLNAPITGASGTFSHVSAYWGTLYFVEAGTFNVYYLNLGAIGGPANLLPLGAYFTLGGELLCSATWQLETAFGVSTTIAFISSMGEIVLFSGNSPIATNWTLFGSYKAAPPVGINCVMKAGGDLLIATIDGIVAMSKIITLAQVALENTAITLPIAPAWNAAQAGRPQGPAWQIVPWDIAHMAIVNLPKLTPNDSTQFVANSRTGAWAQYLGWDANCFGVFNNLLFYGDSVGNVWQAEIGGSDAGASAYTSTVMMAFSSFGAPVQQKQMRLVKAYIQTAWPLASQITVNVDFNTTLPAPPDPSGPALGAGIALWDVARWDVGVWAGGITNQVVWQDVQGEGVAIAVTWQTTTQSTQTPNAWLAAFDCLFEVGSVFG